VISPGYPVLDQRGTSLVFQTGEGNWREFLFLHDFLIRVRKEEETMDIFGACQGRCAFRRGLLFILTALLVFGLGCGGDDSASSGDDDDDDDDFAGDDDDSAGSYDDDDDDDDAADDDDDDATPPPPEPEEDVDPGTRPRICDGAVFVLNTENDFVSRIDAESMDVITIEVGREPAVLRATEDCSALITLNQADDSVSVIHVGNNKVTDLSVRPGLNELALAPDSRFALVYHLFDGTGGGAQGYGEISIVDLDQESVLSLAIGFPPDKVAFTPDQRAILTSETTVALVGLTDGSFSTIDTGLDIDEGQMVKKIAVTSDGAYGFILAEASTELLALDLSDRTITAIDLDCFPTDLDVAEAGDVTLAVCRQEGKIVVIDNTNLGFAAFTTTETVGSGELTSDGSMALLFTNSSPIERVHLFNPVDGEMTNYLTVKPLIGAAIAPGDDAAVLFHFGGDGDPIDSFDEYFDHHEAFSVMNLNDGRINPVEVPETPLEVAFGEVGRYALVPLPEHRKVVLTDLVGGLADIINTPSTPLDVGLAEDLGLGFVLQDHPLGRISFFDLADLEVRTITGFLLNGGIEQ
jgi:hypothetical protein